MAPQQCSSSRSTRPSLVLAPPNGFGPRSIATCLPRRGRVRRRRRRARDLLATPWTARRRRNDARGSLTPEPSSPSSCPGRASWSGRWSSGRGTSPRPPAGRGKAPLGLLGLDIGTESPQAPLRRTPWPRGRAPCSLHSFPPRPGRSWFEKNSGKDGKKMT